MAERPESYKGKEPYVFVSYAHADAEKVYSLITGMQKEKYRLWFDRGIKPNDYWREVIASRIENCSIFLAVISREYVHAKFCPKEIFYADELEKPMMVVYLEDVKLPGAMAMCCNQVQKMFKHQYPEEENFFADVAQAVGMDAVRESAGTGTAAAPVTSVTECTATAREETGSAAGKDHAAYSKLLRELAHPHIKRYGIKPHEEDYPLSRWCRLKMSGERGMGSLLLGGMAGAWASMVIPMIVAPMPGLNLIALVARLMANHRVRQEARNALRDRSHVLLQTASALEYIHDRGMALGYLTPEMIRITKQPSKAGSALLDGEELESRLPRMYIHDIHRIRLMGETVDKLPACREGDRDFVAPEIRGGDSAQARADIYSLGVLLHSLLLQDEMLIRRLSKSTCAALQLVEEKATAADPRRRYGSVAEFAREFRAALSIEELTK